MKIENVYTLARELARVAFPYKVALREFRRAYLTAVLEECHWNQSKAARLLGMHRNTLCRTISDLAIKLPQKPRLPRAWRRAVKLSRKPVDQVALERRFERAS